MNRAERRAASRGKVVRHEKKAPPSLLFCPQLKDMHLAEHTAVMAFRGGWANGHHFDMLLECVVMLGSAAKDPAKGHEDAGTMNVCELASTALLNIRDRYDSKHKLGATGDELKALDLLVETSADFWPRQSPSIYFRAYAATGEWKRSAHATKREAA